MPTKTAVKVTSKRASVKKTVPALPDKHRNLIVIVFFAKHPEKVAKALNFKKMTEIKQVAASMAQKGVVLSEGKYGYFWLTSGEGFLFEICRGDVVQAIESLYEPFKTFLPVCANKTLFVHSTCGFKYDAVQVEAKMTELRKRLTDEGHRVSVLV